jgi:hypothetical protein
VTVTALALPLLLLAHWLLRAENRAHRRVFGTLSCAMVALLFVVVASALQRMYLYTQEYGLTELRLYSTIFMVWLSTVLVWFLLTVPRGRRDSFALGVLTTGFVSILLINAMNPDALIARVNVDRMEAGKRFDAYYLTALSADAVPAMIEALPAMDEEDRHVVEDHLEDFSRWSSEDRDWRTWNLSRTRAQYLIEATQKPATGARSTAQSSGPHATR